MYDILQLLMLTTNMIRKDLNSQNQYDAGLALSGLSCFISPDLARDLANDIMTLVSTFLLFYFHLHCNVISG
jgi:AP-3 complex subunit delta-1